MTDDEPFTYILPMPGITDPIVIHAPRESDLSRLDWSDVDDDDPDDEA